MINSKKTNWIAGSQFFVLVGGKQMTQWTKNKLDRYIKEGRGQGVGAEYKPWTNTYEFSSMGRATRIYSPKTKRIHQLHSDNQYRAFLLFEFNSRVIDIRESFPLLDVLEIIDTKDDLRFDKFTDKTSGEPYVLTTNILLTLQDRNGDEKLMARTIKNTTELNRKITIERLEIERRYWHAKGIDWKVMTQKELPRQLAKNIEWVREALLEGNEIEMDKEQLSLIMLKYLLENDEQAVREVLKLFDKQEMMERGAGLYLLRYLIAKGEIKINMSDTINLSSKVTDLFLREVN